MHAPDVESLERATAAAVSPQWLHEHGGWLLALDRGTVRRACSAVPLRHEALPVQALPGIEARYRARGLRPAFRVCDAPCFEELRAALVQAGYRPEQPTLTLVGAVDAMAAAAGAGAEAAAVAARPDEAWAALFLGPGFDPVDGAHRVRALGRAAGSVYASVREHGATVAAGAGAFSHGWASVHGMRTAPDRRGRGLAGRVLAALAGVARQRGLGRVFLQVEEGNAPARALYRRAGLETVWRYHYWRQPD